jgi:hypothetical protein
VRSHSSLLRYADSQIRALYRNAHAEKIARRHACMSVCPHCVHIVWRSPAILASPHVCIHGGLPLYLPHLNYECSHGGRPLYLLFLRILGSCPITWLLARANGKRSSVLELDPCVALWLLLLLWRSPAIFASLHLGSFCGRPHYLLRLRNIATAVARHVSLQSVKLSLAFAPYGIVLAMSHASLRVGVKIVDSSSSVLSLAFLTS